MTEREKQQLSDALLEWRIQCAISYFDRWHKCYARQVQTHYYELHRRDLAS